MQIDSETAAIVGMVSSVISAAFGYGIMKEKVRKLEESVRRDADTVVSYRHFDSVVAPMQRSIQDIQNDIKKILIILTQHGKRKAEEDE